jgi:hypothetical protein
VNGGAILAKREVLQLFPWNELLYWNQGEDVELSRRMQQRSIYPRYARTLELVVLQVRDGYIESFEKSRINNQRKPGRYDGVVSKFLQSQIVGALLRAPAFRQLVKSKWARRFQTTFLGAWIARRLVIHLEG